MSADDKAIHHTPPSGYKKPSLYLTILTIFMAIAMFIAASVTWYNYHKGKQAAKLAADAQLLSMSDKVLLETRRVFEPAIILTAVLNGMDDSSAKPELHAHPVAPLLLDALEHYHQLLSLYLGFDDGDFYQAVSFHGENRHVRRILGAPADAVFGLRTVFMHHDWRNTPLATVHPPRRVELWVWLNNERKIVGSRAVPVSEYDPRTRPWFRLAGESGGIVMTDYYIFASSSALGFTVAQRFDGPVAGVIGVDMTGISLSHFLREQNRGTGGLVFMFTDTGKLTAYPDPERVARRVTVDGTLTVEPVFLDSFDDPVAATVFSLYRQAPGSELREFNHDGEPWLARITPVPGVYGRTEMVAVATPLSVFTASLDRTRNESLVFAFGITLCMIPVIVFASRRISGPLSQLARDAERIRAFRLEGDHTVVQSRIKEVAELAIAFASMKQVLGTFATYLPKALVRQFVISDIVPHLGGERRELSLLFTDVANFTALSEQLDAETLMLRASEYFQELSVPVLEGSGTIDKFIGDAMMAFWNAPVPQPDHHLRACAAAMRCRNAVNTLNARWKREGKQPMLTRIGLHTGECIVGNVGTTDRMNYTVMGAHVNLAARLEGLNKFYETAILASGEMYDKANEAFLFRSVDLVRPKGTTAITRLYELVSQLPGYTKCYADPAILAAPDWTYTAGDAHARDASAASSPPDSCGPAPEAALLHRHARWEEAITRYRGRDFAQALLIFDTLLAENPQDALASMYVQRCTLLLENPPDEDWSPVVTFTEK